MSQLNIILNNWIELWIRLAWIIRWIVCSSWIETEWVSLLEIERVILALGSLIEMLVGHWFCAEQGVLSARREDGSVAACRLHWLHDWIVVHRLKRRHSSAVQRTEAAFVLLRSHRVNRNTWRFGLKWIRFLHSRRHEGIDCSGTRGSRDEIVKVN